MSSALKVTLACAILSMASPVMAVDGGDWTLSGFTLNGFVRSETAFANGGDKQDPFNQNGNPFNGRTVNISDGGTGTTVTRNGVTDHQSINLQMFRAELHSSFRYGPNLTFVADLRAIVDPGWYEQYNPAAINSHAVGRLYGSPNYFKYDAQGLPRPMPLEWSGSNYMVDFPSLFLEYQHGPLDVRLGNQQIAWGHAIFFRVLDVPDGLDYRRHSALDYVPEEFSDKRVPAPALRVSYQMGSNWLADAYVQKFQPTIYSNPNTPYNQIASQFTIHDLYKNYDNKVDYGIRFSGNIGAWGIQAIYARRYNPDGVYRWTESGVNPGGSAGALLAQTPFEQDPSGVWSADEWFTYAGLARLNGITGLNAAINDFPAAQALGARPVSTYAQAHAELDSFFGALGPLRGHLAREYRREDDIGAGASYVTSGAPGSLLDQLIVNLEVLYVPNRTFTAPDLNTHFLRKHEWTGALVLEKYQRLMESLPATYFVFQAFYKSESDLFGRYLGGMGGSQTQAAPGYGGGYRAIAFALQQPFPNLIWRADFGMLYDMKGGLLLQPAIRWQPNDKLIVTAFYNYINGHLGRQTDNTLGGVDYADEFTVRIGYQFGL